jgi:hypothetical protein
MSIKAVGFALEQLVASGIHKRLSLLPDDEARARVLSAVTAYARDASKDPVARNLTLPAMALASQK